jgi:hypothetical protein
MSFDFYYNIHNHILVDDDRYISVFDSLDVCRLPSGRVMLRVVLSTDFCCIINTIIDNGYGKLDTNILKALYGSRRSSCISLYLLICWVFGDASRIIPIDDLRLLYRYRVVGEIMRHFKSDFDDLSFVLNSKGIGLYRYDIVKDGKLIKGVKVYKS